MRPAAHYGLTPARAAGRTVGRPPDPFGQEYSPRMPNRAARTRAAEGEPAASDSQPAPPVTPAGDQLYQTIVDRMADGVYLVDPDRTIRYWSPGAERISGHPASEVVGRRCYDNILDHVDARGRSLCHTTCPLAATMRDGKDRQATVWLRHGLGHRKPVRLRATPLRDEAGEIVGGIEYFADATQTLAAEEEADRARHEALTDALTGQPNRRRFDDALLARLGKLSRYGWPFGLLIVDLDHFKAINDEHGHSLGDAALTGVAATLSGALRSDDLLARWGGEEFAVIVEASDGQALREAAERMRVLVNRSEIRFEGRRLPVTVSVGGAMAHSGDTPATLFERADGALYSAKNGGRNRTEIAA
jgi:diguanylate cyclase (GGDEF)-like protein/PAS domain S-box-containing protein